MLRTFLFLSLALSVQRWKVSEKKKHSHASLTSPPFSPSLPPSLRLHGSHENVSAKKSVAANNEACRCSCRGRRQIVREAPGGR